MRHGILGLTGAVIGVRWLSLFFMLGLTRTAGVCAWLRFGTIPITFRLFHYWLFEYRYKFVFTNCLASRDRCSSECFPHAARSFAILALVPSMTLDSFQMPFTLGCLMTSCAHL